MKLAILGASFTHKLNIFGSTGASVDADGNVTYLFAAANSDAAVVSGTCVNHASLGLYEVYIASLITLVANTEYTLLCTATVDGIANVVVAQVDVLVKAAGSVIYPTAAQVQAAASLDRVLGTALTETTPGWLAAAFKKFLDVEVPLLTTAEAMVDVSGLATAATQTTILARLGDFAGTGLNSAKGFLQAMFRKDGGVTGANTPSEINEVENTVAGGFDGTTDSQEAIRDRGDAAWITATGFATPTNVSDAQTAITNVLTAIKGAGWTTETLHAIYDAIPVFGTGAYPITLYVKTNETPAVPVQNAKIRINATGGTCVLTTNSLGAAVVNLDNGTYTAYVGSAASYTPAASYIVVVAGGVLTSPAGGILVVTAVLPPDPPAADEVTIYSDEYDPLDNTLVGAADRTAYVAMVEGASRYSATQLAHLVALSDKGDGKNTNASGRWTMTLLAGITIVIKITDNTINKSEGWRVTLPTETGTYCLWQLAPTEVSLLY